MNSVLEENPVVSTLRSRLLTLRSALWLRPAIMCGLALATALLIGFFGGFLPDAVGTWLPEVEDETVKEVLRVLAGSMLTVATVTLSMLMLVLSIAAGNASPRAVPELMADPVTQNALGTFLAAFVFALASLLVFGLTGLTRSGTSVVLIIALLIAANAVRYLVQWIHHVASTLKINQVVARVYRQADSVLGAYLAYVPPPKADQSEPEQAPLPRPQPGEGAAIQPGQAGFVQLVDSRALTRLVLERGVRVCMAVEEGTFVHPSMPLLHVAPADRIDDDLRSRLAATVVIGEERSPEGDPLLGIELLAEIACRALSPGINDPKTALICVGYLEALLARAALVPSADYPPALVAGGRVLMRRPDYPAMIERAYRPIARDGAGKAEILLALARACLSLSSVACPEYLPAIAEICGRLRQFAEGELAIETDRTAVLDLLDRIAAHMPGRTGGRQAAPPRPAAAQ